ncbi:aldehyde dehydrogenase family protein [Leifsonia sp. WHRI 6310E]|uniref:aldehyde dehydrogenase family protein n=1 Tax=Leifsonia sp. WHRI 6310E TaxID=3162562 RepID=UPI0032EE73C9
MDRSLYIDGRWVAARSGETIDVVDPATRRLVGRSSLAGAPDVDLAVEAARIGFATWSRTPAAERASILHRAAALVNERVDEIAAALTLEQGKPLADSRKEILFGAVVLDYYAEEGKRLGGSVRPSDRPDIRSIVSWAPLGIVGAIVPWNYPIDLYCWKIGPALAAGNAVIVKPPLETPLAVGLLVQALHDAGLPAGVLADLPGGIEAGQRLASHPQVDMITATASTRTGQALMRTAADTMKRLSLELGGQSPFIVLDDADVEEAAAAAARRSFSNTGQICIAVNRVIVADSLADDFVAALAEEASRIRLGHGTDDDVTCGPATTAGVIRTARAHIDDALARGATLVAGGSTAAVDDLPDGLFFQPTVLDHVPTTALSMNEETFGPVVAVHRFAPYESATALANATPFGLAAYVYGRDLDRAWAVAEGLHAGGVGVNVNDVTELQAPFGGWKMSGFGRELGPEGLTGFSQQRHIRIRRHRLPEV